MRQSLISTTCFVVLILIFGCSGGSREPLMPSISTINDASMDPNSEVKVSEASDVLYIGDSREMAYKAFGIYQVILDPKSLTAEIIPSRKSEAIGMTFDSDLTQFLTVSPCENCLVINGIRFIPPDQVEVGFAVKHPFADIAKRPDLHGFDVRGIVLAKGNWNFPLTQVALDATTNVAARANVSLLANPDGYTHHFDELASDPHYFEPPRDYNANINPFRRYFVDGDASPFDPHNPSGHNVMKVGADWETQKYIFNVGSGPNPIDFAFVVDCAYGQSATFQNRTNPYYFLPEFNRKEAWNVDVNQMPGGAFYAGDTSSLVDFKVEICDWQAGLVADPNYPDTSNLGGIKAKSDVAGVSIEIPAVSSLAEKTTPDSGAGTEANPYVYTISVTNSQGAVAGWYYGIAAVRDDLQGQQGPIAIPETPAGFPYPGPEIYDYSTYSIFRIRVYGSSPVLGQCSYNDHPFEGELVNFDQEVTEPDGDTVAYLWEQISPVSPMGNFLDPAVKNAAWQAPPLYDVPQTGIEFQIRVTASDDDGQDSATWSLWVSEKNSAPECHGIDTNPFFGVIQWWEQMDLSINASDPDGDALSYEWDVDWDGNPANFMTYFTGPEVLDYAWYEPGFYKVGCRLTEQRANPLSTICSRDLVDEGPAYDMKVDDSSEVNPGYCDEDVFMLRDSSGNPVYHIVYRDSDDGSVHYCKSLNRFLFTDYQVISPGPSSGYTGSTAIGGSGSTIHVIWVEADMSSVPIHYYLKINTSTDGGENFGAMGGERIVAHADDPNVIWGGDICAGPDPDLFYIFYQDSNSGNYRCYAIVSYDGGVVWYFPPFGGMFRDVLSSNPCSDPRIKVSPDGTIHVFWRDYRGFNALYYDWSTDGGTTWHTDMQVSQYSVNPFNGKMAIDDNNNAYFTWFDTDDGYEYFQRALWGDPPYLASETRFFDAGASNYYGSDIWVSPTGKTIIIPIIVDIGSGYFETYYAYSNTSGIWLRDSFTQYLGYNAVSNVVCDGRWETDPNRAEIFAAWIDNRTSLAPQYAHIWGQFVYLVERF